MKKNWILILCLVSIFLIHVTGQIGFAKEPVRLYFFYSEESGGVKLLEEFIQPLSKKYPLEIRSLSINKMENYDLLGRYEKELDLGRLLHSHSSSSCFRSIWFFKRAGEALLFLLR